MDSIPRYWWPFIYQYFFGGAVFLLGIWVILKTKACDLRRPGEVRWFTLLLVGMCAYFCLHLIWYLLAIYVLPEAAGAAS